jgi:hypothetical protein
LRVWFSQGWVFPFLISSFLTTPQQHFSVGSPRRFPTGYPHRCDRKGGPPKSCIQTLEVASRHHRPQERPKKLGRCPKADDEHKENCEASCFCQQPLRRTQSCHGKIVYAVVGPENNRREVPGKIHGSGNRPLSYRVNHACGRVAAHLSPLWVCPIEQTDF